MILQVMVLEELLLEPPFELPEELELDEDDELLDEEVARLHLGKLGVKMDTLSKEQADYLDHCDWDDPEWDVDYSDHEICEE